MGIRAESSVLGMGLAIGSIIIMPVLAVEKKRVGDKEHGRTGSRVDTQR